MGLLNRERILRKRELPREQVPCPEWGDGESDCYVYVRALSAGERDEWDGRMHEPRGESQVACLARYKDFRATFAVKVICDADGKPILTPFDVDDLSRQSSAPLQRIWDKMCELSATTEIARKDLEKNSEATPHAGSSSSSPANGVAPLTRPASESAAAT